MHPGPLALNGFWRYFPPTPWRMNWSVVTSRTGTRRLRSSKDLPLLEVSRAVADTVGAYVSHYVMPADSAGDALHLSLAQMLAVGPPSFASKLVFLALRNVEAKRPARRCSLHRRL